MREACEGQEVLVPQLGPKELEQIDAAKKKSHKRKARKLQAQFQREEAEIKSIQQERLARLKALWDDAREKYEQELRRTQLRLREKYFLVKVTLPANFSATVVTCKVTGEDRAAGIKAKLISKYARGASADYALTYMGYMIPDNEIGIRFGALNTLELMVLSAPLSPRVAPKTESLRRRTERM